MHAIKTLLIAPHLQMHLSCVWNSFPQIIILLSVCDTHFPKHMAVFWRWVILNHNQQWGKVRFTILRQKSKPRGNGGEAACLIKAIHLVVRQTHFFSCSISDMHIFWEVVDPRKTRDLKEQPSADLWQAQLLLALMAACSPHLITRQVFRDEGV